MIHGGYRTTFAIIAAIVFAGSVTACSSGDKSGDQKSVTGAVTEVNARSVSEFETLTIVDADGKEWEFTASGFAGMTPSHLAEHRALGEPVTVWYTEQGSDLIAVTIEDG